MLSGTRDTANLPSGQYTRMFICGLLISVLAACTNIQSRRGENVQVVSASLAPVYRPQTFSLDPVGLPIASVPGDNNDLWVVTEFGDSLHHISTEPTTVERFKIPMNVVGRHWPFVEEHGWRIETAHSERIVKDNQGRLWFAQNGSWYNAFHTQDVINNSRIISYDPRNKQFCVYPVPDSNAGVMGIAWDEARNLVWFGQTGNNTLVAFNPDKLRDCETYNRYRWELNKQKEWIYDFPVQYCTWSGETTCFRKFVLPFRKTTLINQIAVQQPGQPDAGAVWITEFVGGHIGRFDMTSGEYQRFPIDTDKAAFQAMGLGAGFYHRTHQILIHPQNGDLVFSTNGTGQLFRFDIQKYLFEPAQCMELDNKGYNQCMDPIQVPIYKGGLGKSTTHSLSFDRFANLWFTTWIGKCPSSAPPPSIGFVSNDWQKLVYFNDPKLPPQDIETTLQPGKKEKATIECAKNGFPPWGFKGISVDEENNVWFSNFFQQLIYKLNYSAGKDENPYDLYCDEQCRVRAPVGSMAP